jgi:hypothetical protein
MFPGIRKKGIEPQALVSGKKEQLFDHRGPWFFKNSRGIKKIVTSPPL